MMELLKIIKFDCDLERFAEVFGDDIDFEDRDHFQRVAPFTLEELNEERLNRSHFFNYGSPNFEFECIDCVATAKLSEAVQTAGLEPADLQILRAFFRFVNDAYGWDDLGDLERWEEELFNSLNGYEQKNYKPLTLNEDTESRTRLFNKFIGYIAETVGKFEGVEVVRDCLDLVKDETKGGL